MAEKEIKRIGAYLPVLRSDIKRLLPTDSGACDIVWQRGVVDSLEGIALLPSQRRRKRITRRKRDVVVVDMRIEASERVGLNVDHLQGVDVGLHDGVRYGVGVLAARHGSDLQLRNALVVSVDSVAWKYRLPLVGYVPSELRDVGGTHRQRVGIVERVGAETFDGVAVCVDGEEGVCLRRDEIERQEILLHGAVLCGDIDGVLQVARDGVKDSLHALLWLGIDVWHGGLTYRQVDEVVVFVRRKVVERVAVEINHLEVRIARHWRKELQCVGVLGDAIRRSDRDESSPSIVLNINGLSLFLELSRNLWERLCARKQVDDIALLHRRELEGRVDVSQEMAEVNTVEVDLLECGVVGRQLAKHIDAIVVGGDTILSCHAQDMYSVFNVVRNRLETVVGSPCE